MSDYTAGASPACTPEKGLLEIYVNLGPNARRILLEVARRLEIGLAHGDFEKPHNWKKEKREELLDFVVYEIADTLNLGTGNND